MRLVCISDTHGLHDQLVVPDGDVLIHAGDFSNRGRQQEVRDFAQWFAMQPHAHKIVIAGNHDFLFEEEPELARPEFDCFDRVHYLQDEALAIDGRLFYGYPWQPRFHDWAFNLDRDSAEMRDVCSGIPKNVDVLITHGPPHGILDLCPAFGASGLVNVGCEVLRREIEFRAKPKVHVFGHIHEGYGTHDSEQTRYVNASTCSIQYQPTNPPIVLDL